MPKTFTPENDLLRFVYGEMSGAEKSDFIEQIEAKTELKTELAELAEVIDSLSKIKLDAHPTSIQLIMEYSAKKLPLQVV